MEENAERACLSVDIPIHIISLLALNGFESLSDLQDLTTEMVSKIEHLVKNDFATLVDVSNAAEVEYYLGSCKNYKLFSIPLQVKNKIENKLPGVLIKMK